MTPRDYPETYRLIFLMQEPSQLITASVRRKHYYDFVGA